jgi:hypothetical protein
MMGVGGGGVWGERNVMGRGTRRLEGGFDSFCSLVTDFSSTHTLHTHVEKKILSHTIGRRCGPSFSLHSLWTVLKKGRFFV